jgi:hypothetical protein
MISGNGGFSNTINPFVFYVELKWKPLSTFFFIVQGLLRYVLEH